MGRGLRAGAGHPRSTKAEPPGAGPGLGGGAGPAGARTQPARPLPAAMLAGEWVSNGAGRGGAGGGGSAGSRRSRLPSATGARSRAPGSARRGRSTGEPRPARLGGRSGPRARTLPLPGRTPPEHGPSPRACTPPPERGPHLRRDPFLPHRLRPAGWSAAHSPSGSLIPLQGPPISPSGGSVFHILGAWGTPRSHPRSGSPSRPHRLPFSLEQPHPSSPGHFAPSPGPGAPSLRESGEGSAGPLAGMPAVPLSGLLRAPSPPRGPGFPSPPPPHGTAGTGAAEPGSSCLLFRVGWQRPRPAVLLGWSGWGHGCVGPPLPGDPSSLAAGRFPRSSAPWERPALPRGV